LSSVLVFAIAVLSSTHLSRRSEGGYAGCRFTHRDTALRSVADRLARLYLGIAAPLCGFWPGRLEDYQAMPDIPIQIHHGTSDTIVPFERSETAYD